ncbi:DUF11 domain-containing protein [Pseudomarimonas arenosa]|uniref:DUF11 domain-containing protein n=1 Tax=Pseudomarimonas arenosa TaxID=2774145 RepID=A0AAW3ZMT8_9GAMM|nr:DUF11 domain-containing protein [Pseudomarimonas arenosa]MBD8526479.1 DUF11 domain-containing protein [Pseudomarimonas arenosa]
MKVKTIGCLSLFLMSAGAQASESALAKEAVWSRSDVERIAALAPADRRAALKQLSPADRRGLWFAVMSEVRANRGAGSPATRGQGAYQGAGNRAGGKRGPVKFDTGAKVVGTIQYDDGVANTTFGGGAIIGNRFNSARVGMNLEPILTMGTVNTVEAVVVQGPAFTTSSAGFVLLGPQTVGGGAMAIFSTFTGATGVTDTIQFSGLGVNYTGDSFFVLFGDFANSYVPAFGTGTNQTQGFHGVVGYTGGMGPNITGTFDFGGTRNGLIRVTGDVLPMELASADLSITKTDGVTSVTAGGTVTYTIVGSNAGPSAVTGATVADTFPAQLSGCTWTCAPSGGTAACTASGSGNINDAAVNLAMGESVTYTATCNVNQGTAGASLINTATISSAVTDPDAMNNSATDTDSIGASADLSITKTDGATTAVAGSSVVYTIVGSNAGLSDVTGATIADTFPAQLTSCTWICAGAGGGTCTASGSGNINESVNLPASGSVTFTATCTVIPATTPGTSIINTATIAAPMGVTDPTPGNNAATDTNTTSSPAAVSATKTVAPAGAGFAPGAGVIYTIVLSNAGPANQADNPGDEFVDPLPGGLSFSSVSATSGTAAHSAGTVTWNGSIPAGGTVTITINASITPAAGGAVVNQATVNFDADGDGTNESSALTDDPNLPGGADGTGFTLAALLIPVNAAWALVLLASVMLGVAMWRRRAESAKR